jgi:hypothetical protein
MRSSAALQHATISISPRVPVEQIKAYYNDRKTQSLLDRYGPGPRVHYHSGIVKEPYGLHSSFTTLKGCIHRAQEKLMARLANLWRADCYLSGEVLDIGCGLGGGSIFWAWEFGASVTAVTCVPSHISWIAKFARQAGVGTQVQPLLTLSWRLRAVATCHAVHCSGGLRHCCVPLDASLSKITSPTNKKSLISSTVIGNHHSVALKSTVKQEKRPGFNSSR